MVRWTLLPLLCLGCSAASGTVLERDPRDAGASVDGDLDATLGVVDGGADEVDAAPAPPGSMGVCRTTVGSGFLDPFEGDALSAERWLVAHTNVAIAGERSTHGFVRDNVAVRDGKLVLRVRGDRYTGAVRGVGADGEPTATGARTGAAIATRDLYMSATYQWEGRLAGPAGVKLVLMARRDDADDGIIAVTAPGRDTQGNASYAFVTARVEGPLGAPAWREVGLPMPLDDGARHNVRFDWHAGPGETSAPFVDVWMDGDDLEQLAGNAPARAARAWLVAFVPEGSPADFDTVDIEVETAFITPFGEVRDRCSDGELVGPGLESPPR